MKWYVLLIENTFGQECIQISFAVHKKLGRKVDTLSKMEACLVRFLPDLLDTTKDSCPCLLTTVEFSGTTEEKEWKNERIRNIRE